MQYAQQANKPDWYETESRRLYAKACGGDSSLDEWYEFESREAAVKFILRSFRSQRFLDNYEAFDGEIYHINALLQCPDCACRVQVIPGWKPASLEEMVQANCEI